MGELSRYKVVMDGTIMPDANREDVVRSLCELFHSRPSRMEKLLSGTPVSLKKEYGKSEAVDILQALREAGARAKLVPIDDSDLQILDDDSALSEFSENVVSPGVPCPACGRECDPNWDRCQHCNYLLESGVADSGNVGLGVQDNVEKNDAYAIPTPATGADAPRSRKTDIADFVGPNASYYLKQFSGMGSLGNPKFKVSWHWPALLVFPFWALYRKLWLWAGAYYLGSMVIIMLSSSTFIMLAYSLAWPLVANYLYYRHVGSVVRAVGQDYEGEQRSKVLKQRGGVSKLALWAGVAVSFAMSLYVMGNLKTTLLAAYNEQFGIQSGELSVTYADGSPLVGANDVSTALGKTVERISALGNALKIVIATGNSEALDRALAGLDDNISRGQLKDGWGNAMRVSRSDGVITLRSPGVDGRLDSSDDLVQSLPFSAAEVETQ